MITTDDIQKELLDAEVFGVAFVRDYAEIMLEMTSISSVSKTIRIFENSYIMLDGSTFKFDDIEHPIALKSFIGRQIVDFREDDGFIKILLTENGNWGKLPGGEVAVKATL